MSEIDVVVVGSGAAGITVALAAAARGLRVVLVTKDLTGGASPLAQGGLAAAIGPCDSPQQHARDTMTAGAGLCDPETVAALAAGSPGAIDWLVALGAQLEQQDLRLEGGHSHRRIVHSGDDASGAEVHRALVAALAASRVEVRARVMALDLTSDGLLAATIGPDGQLSTELVPARAVVLAGGGLGQAFATTSNPAGATGDAIAIAARAGAVLRDLEFVQFHPTVLWSKGAVGQRPLVTEALRGAGAVLRDLAGSPVMAGRHPRGDLAPRDVVAAGMFEVMERDDCDHLWLDSTGLGRATVEDGFPTVTAACRADGIDPARELIPVAPGAHYACGGIATDLAGRTSVPRLYAVGEAASTGFHGANRLASNSLVEAVITGRNAAEAVAADLATPGRGSRGPGGGWALGPPAVSRGELAAAMSRHAGVMRDAEGLAALLRMTGATGWSTAGPAPGLVMPGEAEAANVRVVSALIAAAALERRESRGCHRRRDAPRTWTEVRHTLIRCTPDGLKVKCA